MMPDTIYNVTCTNEECGFQDECHRGTDDESQLDQELSCEERHRRYNPGCDGQLVYEPMT